MSAAPAHSPAPPVSFFVSRKATCEEHSLLAHRAIESIRRIYPGSQITIVDDGSAPDFTGAPGGIDVVPNPFPGSGEAGTLRVARDSVADPRGIAVVMHDSMVACEHVDWDEALGETGIVYLWSFPAVKWMERTATMRLIDRSEPLREHMQRSGMYDLGKWVGCFGAALAARRWALDGLHEGGVLSDELLSGVCNRGDRMGFERVVALGTQAFVTGGDPPAALCGCVNDHPLPFQSLRPHASSLGGVLGFKRATRYKGAFMKTWHGR